MVSSKILTSIDADAAALVAAVTQCLEQHVQPAQRIVVGLSGGVDSVCLLHMLATKVVADNLPIEISAIHVNHGLSLQADHWQAFCHKLCDSLRVAYKAINVVVDPHSPDGIEGAARLARHRVFAALDADWIMLAHQRDDQAETLLFNLLRGTGLAGAAAMRVRNGRLLRPLLECGRREIECYAQLNSLEWCEDESNQNTRFSRNYLRHQVMPLLVERFPAAPLTLTRAAARFAEALDLLNDLARIDLVGEADGFPVSIDLLASLNEARGLNVLRYLLAQSAVQIPSESRLREALRQMLRSAVDRHPTVAFGRHCLRRYREMIYLESIKGSDEST